MTPHLYAVTAEKRAPVSGGPSLRTTVGSQHWNEQKRPTFGGKVIVHQVRPVPHDLQVHLLHLVCGRRVRVLQRRTRVHSFFKIHLLPLFGQAILCLAVQMQREHWRTFGALSTVKIPPTPHKIFLKS